MNTKSARLLQGASVLFAYFITYIGITFIGALIAWPLTLFYMTWMFWCDVETYNRGGRRVEYVRKHAFFRYASDYFPVSLVKTAELDPRRNYIFGYHPHGIIPDGLVISFGSEALQFSEKFPGIVPYIGAHSYLNWSPFFRDIVMALGVVNVSRDSCKFVLTQQGPGHSIAIVIGGASEVLDTSPNSYTLTLNGRKGFAKLALETGSPLVPVFGFGQNDTFEQPRVNFLNSYKTGSPKWEKWGKIILKNTIHLPLARFGMMPQRRPVTIVVGSPIPVEKVKSPSDEQISELHSNYVERLKALFDEHRDACGILKETELVIQ